MSESTILSLPFGSTIASLIVIVLGFAAMYYWFDKDRRARRKEENEADERLVSILQTTVSELEKKVVAQGEEIKVLSEKVGQLEHDNGLLVEILQGKDRDSQDMIALTKSTHELVQSMAKSMNVLIVTLEKHDRILDGKQ